MHFHLPKPLHGWREFVGEVGIIVLGVVIALGFEQVAQSMHDRWTAAEARSAIRAEVRENLWWLERRRDYEPCIDRMLSQLDGILTQARSGQATPATNECRPSCSFEDHFTSMGRRERASWPGKSLLWRRAAQSWEHVFHNGRIFGLLAGGGSDCLGETRVP